MAKVNYSLSAKEDKVLKKSEVLIRFAYGNGLALRAKSGIYIPVSRWNEKDSSLIIPRLETPEQKELTKTQKSLDNLKNVILDTLIETDKKAISKEWLETVIDKYHFPSKYIVKPKTLFEYISYFIDKAPTRKDKATGRTLAYNNIQQYKATQKHIRAFAESKCKEDFEFKDINQDFYNDFVSYLQGLQFTQNSVGKHIRILKLMLNEAPKNLIKDAEYDNFHVFSEDVDTVYLNEAELQQLKDFDFSDIPHLDRVRDWFLLLAWTGSRFSDLEKIGKTDIKDGFITFRQQKTNTKVTIPLHPVVMDILNKYDFNLPEPISNQRFNEYIKEVGKRAGINQTESVTGTIGGKLTTTQQPKYELISSHTGRRSFATNMYKQGLSTLMIMSVTGHKTEKSFLKYIRVKQEEHAKMMAEAWAKIYQEGGAK